MKILAINDHIYPDRLRNIPDAPSKLYVEGNLNLLNSTSIAIIGSRNASENGKTLAKKFSYELSKVGITIISGLARGIDTIAHTSSYNQAGKTIAVLGCGFNNIFPPENFTILKNIVENDGLIISEYSPDTIISPNKFRDRNRIISGLSTAILVIEAKQKSGTGVTFNHALKQNRPVFALPHDINDSHGIGTNRMLKKGAILITETIDILDKLHLDNEKKQFLDLRDSEEKNIENAILSDDIQSKLYKYICNTPISVNELARKTKFSVNEILSALFILEMDGFVKKVEGGFVCTKT